MGDNPIFELFELLCTELAKRPDQSFTVDRVDPELVEDIKTALGETNDAVAFHRALEAIAVHLAERGSAVPYTFDAATLEFRAVDTDYLEFVAFAGNRRGVGGDDSQEFEHQTLRRLRTRLTGDLRRVGVPRDRLKRKSEIVPYLMKLGFEQQCLGRRDKDGGLDILWLPPLGAVPMRPIISFQCKNGFFDEATASASVGRTDRTLQRHSHLRKEHLKFVVFNDYIDRSELEERAVGWSFIPLGLTDLAAPAGPGIDDIL